MGESTADDVRAMVDAVYRADSRRVFATLIRPFAGTNDVEFAFQPEGNNETAVT